jgi:hypothetical protein
MRSHSYKHRSHRFASCRASSVCSELGKLSEGCRKVTSQSIATFRVFCAFQKPSETDRAVFAWGGQGFDSHSYIRITAPSRFRRNLSFLVLAIVCYEHRGQRCREQQAK